jgi:hypothetical protein
LRGEGRGEGRDISPWRSNVAKPPDLPPDIGEFVAVPSSP